MSGTVDVVDVVVIAFVPTFYVYQYAACIHYSHAPRCLFTYTVRSFWWQRVSVGVVFFSHCLPCFILRSIRKMFAHKMANAAIGYDRRSAVLLLLFSFSSLNKCMIRVKRTNLQPDQEFVTKWIQSNNNKKPHILGKSGWMWRERKMNEAIYIIYIHVLNTWYIETYYIRESTSAIIIAQCKIPAHDVNDVMSSSLVLFLRLYVDVIFISFIFSIVMFMSLNLVLVLPASFGQKYCFQPYSVLKSLLSIHLRVRSCFFKKTKTLGNTWKYFMFLLRNIQNNTHYTLGIQWLSIYYLYTSTIVSASTSNSFNIYHFKLRLVVCLDICAYRSRWMADFKHIQNLLKSIDESQKNIEKSKQPTEWEPSRSLHFFLSSFAFNNMLESASVSTFFLHLRFYLIELEKNARNTSWGKYTQLAENWYHLQWFTVYTEKLDKKKRTIVDRSNSPTDFALFGRLYNFCSYFLNHLWSLWPLWPFICYGETL